MKKKAIGASVCLVALLAGCQPAEQSKEAGVARYPAAAPTSTSPPAAPTTKSDTSAAWPGAALLYAPLRSSADTLLRIGGRRLYLQLQARLDTTQRLVARTEQDTTTAGYQGYFTFVLRDSLHQLVVKRVLTKQLFYKAVGQELAISSGACLPVLLGYSAPMKALVFTLNFAAPESDWMCNAVLLLDLQGRIRHLSQGYGVGGPAVEVGLARDGRTVLTGTEFLRANSPALPLQRPQTELRGALLLNDSLALTVYDFGRNEPALSASQRVSPTLSPKLQPNAFVVNTHSGQLLTRFRYQGFFEELGVTIPWHRLPATHTGYFLDDKKGLYLLSEAQPTHVRLLPFASLVKFKPPQRTGEVMFDLHGYNKTYRLYVDTLAPSAIRYTYERTALD
jgi:hypothetical protein